MTVDNFLDLLPQHLAREQNVIYIAQVLTILLNDSMSRLVQIETNISILQAENFGLDLLGEIIGEERQGRSDSDYRRALLTAVIRNRSRGTIEDINNYARSLIGERFLGVMESGVANFVIRFLPSNISNLTQLIDTASPAGVSVSSQISSVVPITGFYTVGLPTNLYQATINIDYE